MIGFIYAAGHGTRLSPLTQIYPKPAVPFCGRPLFAQSADVLKKLKLNQIVSNTCSLAPLMESLLSAEGISAVREEELLGTAGGIKHALKRSGAKYQTVVAINGDVVSNPDLHAAMQQHESTKSFATMVVMPTKHETLQSLACEGTKLHAIYPSIHDTDLVAKHMFTGIQILSKEAIDSLPDKGCMIRDGYQKWLNQRKEIGVWTHAGYFSDLGTPKSYLETTLSVARQELLWVKMGKGEILNQGEDTSWVECGAIVTAPFKSSIALPGARINRYKNRCIVSKAWTLYPKK